MKNYEWKLICGYCGSSSQGYRYACEDFPGVTVTETESRRVTSYRGTTTLHQFIVKDRDSGYKRIFTDPVAARRFVESGQLEKAIRSSQPALATEKGES